MPNIKILVQGFPIAIMAESKNGHNLFNISRNSLLILAGHLNINPKPCAKYQNPS